MTGYMDRREGIAILIVAAAYITMLCMLVIDMNKPNYVSYSNNTVCGGVENPCFAYVEYFPYSVNDSFYFNPSVDMLLEVAVMRYKIVAGKKVELDGICDNQHICRMEVTAYKKHKNDSLVWCFNNGEICGVWWGV